MPPLHRGIARGDIVLVDFAPARDGEANYRRPAVVITNDRANELAPVVTVVPLTSNVDHVYPFQLFLPTEETGLDRDGKARVELLRHVSEERVERSLARVPATLMRELDVRLREHLALG